MKEEISGKWKNMKLWEMFEEEVEHVGI